MLIKSTCGEKLAERVNLMSAELKVILMGHIDLQLYLRGKR